jgi:hypothetical protein
MADPMAFDDPTLALWRAKEERKDREQAEQQVRPNRLTALERGFSEVRNGMPEARDNEQSALAFAARWGCLARLLSTSPDLVHRPLEEIKADPHSAKSYALRFVRTALVNEAEAAKLLLNSWQASKACHSDVLYWLTGGLEAEIRGTNLGSQSRALLPEQDSLPDEVKPPQEASVQLLELSPSNTIALVFVRNADIENSISNNPRDETVTERVQKAEGKIRALLIEKPELRNAKCTKVIKTAQVRRQDGLAALRKLQQAGDYIGTSAVPDE